VLLVTLVITLHV